MNSRDAILHRIRTRLSGGPAAAAPPVPEVWRRENADPETLAGRFAENLKAVFGEPIRCPSMAEAQRQLADLMQSGAWPVLGGAGHSGGAGSDGRIAARSD